MADLGACGYSYGVIHDQTTKYTIQCTIQYTLVATSDYYMVYSIDSISNLVFRGSATYHLGLVSWDLHRKTQAISNKVYRVVHKTQDNCGWCLVCIGE